MIRRSPAATIVAAPDARAAADVAYVVSSVVCMLHTTVAAAPCTGVDIELPAFTLEPAA